MTPRCACHGELMYLQRRTGIPTWGCRVKKRERDNAYLLTDRGRARARRFRLRETITRRERFIKRVEELRSRSEVHREDRG